MIKVGLNHNLPDFVSLYRMLKAHPDVEIKWVHNFGRTVPIDQMYPQLAGEGDFKFAETLDLNDINLYIGPDLSLEVMAGIPDLKVIGVSQMRVPELNAEIGLPEYNRKALVRGARVAYLPDEFTYLGALALMPLAKNLLLGDAVEGSVVFSSRANDDRSITAGTWNGYFKDWFTEQLTEQVLRPLQQSFGGTFRVVPFNVPGNVSMATFVVPMRMSGDDVRELYHKFYDDHRHVVILGENRDVRPGMVEGTNKAVISINVNDGRLFVSVAFDSRFRMGHGVIVHVMNLLFGLDERTGF